MKKLFKGIALGLGDIVKVTVPFNCRYLIVELGVLDVQKFNGSKEMQLLVVSPGTQGSHLFSNLYGSSLIEAQCNKIELVRTARESFDLNKDLKFSLGDKVSFIAANDKEITFHVAGYVGLNYFGKQVAYDKFASANLSDDSLKSLS